MPTNHLLNTSFLARYLILNAVDISDYQVFPSREIQNAAPSFSFPRAANELAPDDGLPAQFRPFDQFMARNGTVAFLVLQNGQLRYERYFNSYERDSICASFSTAKSFVSALIGIAIHEKLIASLDYPLKMYIPEAPWQDITLRHLVSMSSGLKYREGGVFPWDDEPRTYYSLDLRRLALAAQKSEVPGTCFRYNNYNLILLGMVLERVTGRTVSAFLQEKLWQPLGMEFPASWSLDSEQSGMEKMESGLNARAIDFAKFGQLYLQHGAWNGKQIIPENWVTESTTVVPGDAWKHYKYLWWMSRSGNGRFTAVGNLGQFIFVAPEKNCVIVRLGRGKPDNWKMAYPQLFGALANLL